MAPHLPHAIDDNGPDRRVAAARALLAPCRACPLDCDVDRLAGEVGRCKVGRELVVGSAGLHFGEEACLVGRTGAGAVFFSGCNLACVFCQSHAISVDVIPRAARQPGASLVRGTGVTVETLADGLLDLQSRGAATINLISPTHYGPQVVELLTVARQRGLTRPVVYNCGGYEALALLRWLDGLVDIYLPDVKTLDTAAGERLLGVPNYPDRVRAALVEMHRQVGDLQIGPDGIAQRGLLVRHLVMPGGTSTTPAVLEMLAGLSGATAVNIMDQYRPAHRAWSHADIAAPVDPAEVAAARERAVTLGLRLIGAAAPPTKPAVPSENLTAGPRVAV